MIPPPLLLFKKHFSRLYHSGQSGLYEDYIKNHFNFIYGNKALLVFTVSFLVFKLINFLSLRQRPAPLFIPDNYFGKLFMPHLPAPEVYITIAILAIFICFCLLIKPEYY